MATMQVEIFTQAEVGCEDETEHQLAANIAERMGLDGQKARRAAQATRAFAEITVEQRIVYKHFCPSETPLESYQADTIPLRVLEVAEQCKPHFEKMVVWHPALASEKDPVLLGVNKDKTHTWMARYFPLARWGEVLDEFPAMLKRVREHLLRARKAELAVLEIEAKAVMRRMEIDPDVCTLANLADALGYNPKRLIGG